MGRCTSAVLVLSRSFLPVTLTSNMARRQKGLAFSARSDVLAEKDPTKLLSNAWAPLIQQEFHPNDPNEAIRVALLKTLPLLLEAENPNIIVPFVCRYRQDTIQPLGNAAIHELACYVQRHAQLESLRNKILTATKDPATILRAQTSCSRTELNDLYAPFKPESKGSLEERIKLEHPKLVEQVDAFWENPSGTRLKRDDNTIVLLANRIAKHVESTDACQAFCDAYCSIEVKQASSKAKGQKDEHDDKYQTYHDFDRPICHLRDHQVLAIRRGVDQKRLTMKFALDNDRAERAIRQALSDRMASPNIQMWLDSIHNCYTRLLRKRCTSRSWKAVCDRASDRGIRVFCDNLRSALLAPPMQPSVAVLSLDPGFKAGIKVALVDSNGQLLTTKGALRTIHFVESWERGRAELVQAMKDMSQSVSGGSWIVALGNGHGTREAERLSREALAIVEKPNTEIRLVDEAGASVWSVTEAASSEYPSQAASALAAISIARRLQNPLNELVKIPPRSLGLGMYQHDYTEKELEERLEAASIDAVAEVGVDGNSCSLDILEKVPGLNRRLAKRIIQKRPLQSRNDLLKVSGIGPTAFQSCAAFVRLEDGKEPLDGTLCHPESYDVAKQALRKMKWNLMDDSSIADVPTDLSARKEAWATFVESAANQFCIPEARVLSILTQLIQSIQKKDPRLADGTTSLASKREAYNPLPSDLSNLDKLQKACPLRAIKGTIRNIVDFGAFVDVGAESDGLLHRSKLGSIQLSSLQIGQNIAVDILSVEQKRINLLVHGVPEHQAQPPSLKRPRTLSRNEKPAKKISRRKR